MILSDIDIRAAIAQGRIKVTPELKDVDIQPSSIDLHLGNKIIRFDSYGGKREITFDYGDEIWLNSNEFILAELQESISLDNTVCANIDGKSSIGRKGLFVHVSAGFVDPGWSGILTLEVYNGAPFMNMLIIGQKFCQMKFMELKTPAERSYGHKDLNSHYQNSTKVEISRS